MFFLSTGGAEYLLSLSLLNCRLRRISVELIGRLWLEAVTEEDEVDLSKFSLLIALMSAESKEKTILWRG